MEHLNLDKRMEFVKRASRYINTPEFWLTHKKDFIHSWMILQNIEYINEYINWCSLFIMQNARLEKMPSEIDLAARSWLRVGKRKKDPIIGDLVIFWRESEDSWKGHVGIFIGFDDGRILTLGGNQGGCVCIRSYNPNKLIDYVDITEFLP